MFKPLMKHFALLNIVICIGAETGSGALRLVRNNLYSTIQAWSSGIVEIFYSNVWGNICDDYYFGFDEADVICHQLGYTGASSYGNTGTITIYGNDTNEMLIEDVVCSSSTYLALSQCSGTYQYSTFCNNHNEDVVVSCYSTRIWDIPISGMIRLIGGTYSNQGLLEIYCNGEWGTVCDDYFGSTEAQVTCRQLGYNYYYSYGPLLTSGAASQPIWLDNVFCSTSNYTCLTNCASCPSYEYHDCSHEEDIVLDCGYSSTFPTVSTKTYYTCSNTYITTGTTSTTSTTGTTGTTGSTGTTGTDDHTDIIGTAGTTDISGNTATVSAGIIVGAVVGVIFCIIVCILIFTVPFCLCYYLGVGIGANSNSQHSSRMEAQPTTTTISKMFDFRKIKKQDSPPDYNQLAQTYPYPSAPLIPPGYPQQSASNCSLEPGELHGDAYPLLNNEEECT